MKRGTNILTTILAAWVITQSAIRLLPIPVDHTVAPNDCLIQAVEAEQQYLIKHRLERVEVWTKIVSVCYFSWRKSPTGHAVCVYQLPQNGDIWVYDALHGSRKLNVRPYTHDLKSLGAALHSLDNHYYFARFLD